ncbi:hypothetical protein EJ08DRAFT_646457 [Tothia fuscella]|uniref:Uncharacterized protein n=1 Tax=Tothia fuscella TaxID=1048955 RepID=A0A9P4NZF9_9PEZI|nr:hypothetical protein EJ08DRAFT_646457 [Tothia fuscella]
MPVDPRYPEMLMQPDSRPISQEQLSAEVKSIYAGLVMVSALGLDLIAISLPISALPYAEAVLVTFHLISIIYQLQ